MSAYNPRKNVLERLREREKSRDWSRLDKSYPVSGTQRRWSAESYKEKNLTSSWKPPSPQYLPRLENRPASAESGYDGDLKRGKQTVIPPVSLGQGYARESQTKATNKWNQHATLPRHQGTVTYPPLPSHYPNPAMGSLPHPPMMYPVSMIPVHPGYAPWFAPYPGYAEGSLYDHALHDGRLVRPQNQMSRSQAAVILQKYIRGWQVRKGAKFLLWRYMCDRKHSRKFVEDLIHSFLLEEIIPDVLIDVLSGKKYLSVHDPRYKLSERVLQEIIEDDVTAFIQDIALGIFCSHGRSDLSREDPLLKVSFDIVNEVVKEFTSQVVHSTVEEIVHSHMTLIKTGDWLDNFILEAMSPMVLMVVFEAIQQVKDDDVINGIIDEVIQPQLRQVIIELWRDIAESNRNKQIEKVSLFAKDHFLDALFLQHLLSQLAGDSSSLYFSDYTDQVLDGIICGLLTSQYLAINDDLEATQSNSVVRRFHEKVFCDVALDVLMQELTAHLDEDLHELHESEKENYVFDL